MADPNVCLPADGLIVPENIPGIDIDPAGIDAIATRVGAVARDLPGSAGGVLGAWRGLSGSYVAPESAALLGALDTIAPAVDDISEVFDTLASILRTFAETAAPIRQRLVQLKAQASAFVREARAGYTVEWWHHDHPAFDHGLVGFLTTDFVDMVPKWIPWNKYTDAVERNAELLGQVNEQIAALDQARTEAVNAINALNTVMCAVPEVAMDAETLNQEGMDLPWGSVTRGDRSWYESLGDGVERTVEDLLDGVGALLAIDTGEDAPEDALFQWDLAGQAWSGLAQSVGAVLYSPVSTATLIWGQNWPQWMRDAAEWDSEMLAGVYEGFVGTPEQWEQDPWYAGGRLGSNIVSSLIGAGAGAALKGGSLAARLGAFADNLVPGGRWLVQGADSVGHDLAASTRGLAAGLVERWGPRLADETGSLRWLDEVIRDVESDIPGVYPDVDVPNSRPDGDASTTGPDPFVQISETQGNPAASNAISESIAAKTDPVHSGSTGVPGEWTRTGDNKGVTPKDLYYGERVSGHGTSTLPDNPGTGNTGFDQMADPDAPYGRNPDGTERSREDYDARYVLGNGADNYPPNDGAVKGTRIEYTNSEAFIRDYGNLLDRVGEPWGDFMALRPDGVSATWEQRALPVSSLSKTYHEYTFSGRLPEGWRIEISEIRPAFGQPGGGLQVRVLDDNGEFQSIAELSGRGVLT